MQKAKVTKMRVGTISSYYNDPMHTEFNAEAILWSYCSIRTSEGKNMQIYIV